MALDETEHLAHQTGAGAIYAAGLPGLAQVLRVSRDPDRMEIGDVLRVHWHDDLREFGLGQCRTLAGVAIEILNVRNRHAYFPRPVYKRETVSRKLSYLRSSSSEDGRSSICLGTQMLRWCNSFSPCNNMGPSSSSRMS